MKLSISEVEKITGISKDRLRYYEEKKLISPARGEDNSYRSYDFEEIEKVLGIQLYRAMDLGVKEIRSIQEAGSIEEIRRILEERQETIRTAIAELTAQNDHVERSLSDCENILHHLDVISVKKVRLFQLAERLEGLYDPASYEKLNRETDGQEPVIRNIVRRIEVSLEGIGENALFLMGGEASEETDCVYTVIKETAGEEPMMETFEKCRQWILKEDVRIGRYCYIRPMLVSHLGDSTECFLEIIIPLEE